MNAEEKAPYRARALAERSTQIQSETLANNDKFVIKPTSLPSSTSSELCSGTLKNEPSPMRTAFMYYYETSRDKILQAPNPSVPFSEFTNQVTDSWLALSNEAKTPYRWLAEKDMERYNKEQEQLWTDTLAQQKGSIPDIHLQEPQEKKTIAGGIRFGEMESGTLLKSPAIVPVAVKKTGLWNSVRNILKIMIAP